MVTITVEFEGKQYIAEPSSRIDNMYAKWIVIYEETELVIAPKTLDDGLLEGWTRV